MAATGLDNDLRGWILCLVSGAACVLGASVICIDILVDLIPGKKSFRIQESNAFLACSLCLSFGVMLYSALCSMLPESRENFEAGGLSEQSAGLTMMGLFAVGFFGIQAVSRLLHQYIPSHVVDCDHSHSEAALHESHRSEGRGRGHSRSSHARKRISRPSSARMPQIVENGEADRDPRETADAEVDVQARSRTSERTPLLKGGARSTRHPSSTRPGDHQPANSSPDAPRDRISAGDAAPDRRPSRFQVQKRVLSFVKDTKCNCDESGSCYGYSDPCGQECFKHLSSRVNSNARQLPVLQTTTTHFHSHAGSFTHDTHDHQAEEFNERPVSPFFRPGRSVSRDLLAPDDDELEGGDDLGDRAPSDSDVEAQSQHHHHVPTNAFLSIGLQTSIAIALHKFPEGFITFATNHANPDLGFNVFMALFVHNISEGFAMCLPLYMALGSRLRAIGWSALLGGLSQPLGAGIAALWFKLAKRTNMAPGPVSYACLFAVTAGIMVSVGLQLFVEGLSLNHNRNLCILFGFFGMALMGFSNILFAH